MRTTTLRTLESHGLLNRKLYPEIRQALVEFIKKKSMLPILLSDHSMNSHTVISGIYSD